MLSPGARRTAFALAENVRLMAAEFGLERLGFLTLTFADHVTDIREAQRRFNSLATHVLRERYAAFIAVVERMKSKRIHFHLLVALDDDIRTGFDFAAIERQDYTSACAALRAEWAFWRQTARKYRFGRTELLPVKSTADGIAKYVGKYIAKHVDKRLEEDKGARLVRYTKNARKCSTRFAWAGLRGWLWRAKLKQFAAGFGIASPEGMKHAFGPRWAYHLADSIAAEVLTEYPSCEHARADGHDLPDDWKGWGTLTIKPSAVDTEPEGPGVVVVGPVRKVKGWPSSGGWGLGQPPVRPQAVAADAETPWERVYAAYRRGELVKPTRFSAFVPGQSEAGC